jgi:hypothetical protein
LLQKIFTQSLFWLVPWGILIGFENYRFVLM